jgi:hypothetical protein
MQRRILVAWEIAGQARNDDKRLELEVSRQLLKRKIKHFYVIKWHLTKKPYF